MSGESLRWKVVVRGHVVGGRRITPQSIEVIADDAIWARVEAVRQAHFRAGVPAGNVGDYADDYACAIAIQGEQGGT